MGVGEFITCGTMFGNKNDRNKQNQSFQRKPISKMERENMDKKVINNEYLKILQDPKFSDLNVNFMDF